MSEAFHLALQHPGPLVTPYSGGVQDFMGPGAVDEAWITAYYICGAVGTSLERGMEVIE